jgi:hypothetical protein
MGSAVEAVAMIVEHRMLLPRRRHITSRLVCIMTGHSETKLAIRESPANPTGSPAQNPSLYETILSGDLAADDTTVGTDENAFHVVSFIGAEAAMRLDGFVVEAGNASAESESTTGTDIRGGGVYMTHDWTDSGSPCLGVVQNCTIRKNEGRYGGGLVVDGEKPTGTSGSFPVAQPTIRTTLVRDNISWKGGGGMHVEAAPEAAGCVVVENFFEPRAFCKYRSHSLNNP